jgi:hypothetical protein
MQVPLLVHNTALQEYGGTPVLCLQARQQQWHRRLTSESNLEFITTQHVAFTQLLH